MLPLLTMGPPRAVNGLRVVDVGVSGIVQPLALVWESGSMRAPRWLTRRQREAVELMAADLIDWPRLTEELRAECERRAGAWVLSLEEWLMGLPIESARDLDTEGTAR